MNRTFALLMIAAAVSALTGCASVSSNRVYTINAEGYAEAENAGAAGAKKQALENTKQNLISSIARFMEYKFEIDPELGKKIIFNSKIVRQGIKNGTYYAEMSYDLDLYSFMAKNGDFKNIYAWEILGLQPFYSDYMNAYRPIGIWIKDQLADGKRRDPFMMSAFSVIPCFSGNYLIGKPVIGAFFTATKLLALGGAALNAEQSNEIRITSWVGLGVITILDFLSVFNETTALNERLKLLQNAIFTDKSDAGETLMNVKF
jgi:hypothetical protein